MTLKSMSRGADPADAEGPPAPPSRSASFKSMRPRGQTPRMRIAFLVELGVRHPSKSMRPRGQTPRMLTTADGRRHPMHDLVKSMRPRGQTPRMLDRRPAERAVAAIASMRPRGQTPRMLCPGRLNSIGCFAVVVNEAAGADPADASPGSRPSKGPSHALVVNEAAGADPADALFNRAVRLGAPTRITAVNEAAGADPADATFGFLGERTFSTQSMRPRGQTPRMLTGPASG